MRLKTGTWLAGVFATADDGRRSFAVGYPEDQDLYLSGQLQVDPVTGAFLRDETGHPRPVDDSTGLRLRWDEVVFLSIQEVSHDRT